MSKKNDDITISTEGAVLTEDTITKAVENALKKDINDVEFIYFREHEYLRKYLKRIEAMEKLREIPIYKDLEKTEIDE